MSIIEVFDTVWDEFEARERQDLVHLIVKRVTVNEPEGKLDLEFHDLAAPFEPLVPAPVESEPDDDPPPAATSADLRAQAMEASP